MHHSPLTAHALAAIALGAVALHAPDAAAGDVSITTSDGVALHADHWGSGDTGVLLVHDAGRSAEDWAFLGGKLAVDGAQVLALDLRGHGKSSSVDLDDAAYKAMVADVAAGVGWLREHGAAKVILVGAQLGANLALSAAAEDDAIASVALLSPGFNLQGVTIGAIDSYGARPVLIVSAADDSYASRTSGVLEQRATGAKHWAIVPGNASGARMVSRDADVEALLYSWTHGTFFSTKAGSDARSLGAVGDLSEVETTGVKLDDR